MFNKGQEEVYNDNGGTYEGKVPQDKAKLAAINWGEGSPALTELLEFCILNGVKTYTSCKGHSKWDVTFIGFRDMPPIFYKYIISQYNEICSIDLLRFGNRRPKLSIMFVRNSEEDRERKLYELLEVIKEYVKRRGNIDRSEINDDAEKNVEYIFSREGYGKIAHLAMGGSLCYVGNTPNCLVDSKTNKVKLAYSPLFRLRFWGRDAINKLINPKKDEDQPTNSRGI